MSAALNSSSNSFKAAEIGLRSAKPLPANSASKTGIVTTCWATSTARSPDGRLPPMVASIWTPKRSNLAAKSGFAPTAVRTCSVMVPVIRATSRPQRSQYWRSPQAATSRDAMACSKGRRCWVTLPSISPPPSCSHSHSASARPHVLHTPLGRMLMGSRPVRSAVLIATSRRSSCERRALRTFQTALKSEPDKTWSSSRLAPEGTTTGRIT